MTIRERLADLIYIIALLFFIAGTWLVLKGYKGICGLYIECLLKLPYKERMKYIEKSPLFNDNDRKEIEQRRLI